MQGFIGRKSHFIEGDNPRGGAVIATFIRIVFNMSVLRRCQARRTWDRGARFYWPEAEISPQRATASTRNLGPARAFALEVFRT